MLETNQYGTCMYPPSCPHAQKKGSVGLLSSTFSMSVPICFFFFLPPLFPCTGNGIGHEVRRAGHNIRDSNAP